MRLSELALGFKSLLCENAGYTRVILLKLQVRFFSYACSYSKVKENLQTNPKPLCFPHRSLRLSVAVGIVQEFDFMLD